MAHRKSRSNLLITAYRCLLLALAGALLVGSEVAISVIPGARAQESQAASIVGVVTLAGTDRPIPGVQISVISEKSSVRIVPILGGQADVVAAPSTQNNPNNPPIVRAVTDADGRFAIEKLDAGRVAVRFALQDFFSSVPPFSANHNEIVNLVQGNKSELRISLIQAGAISGRVLGPTGIVLSDVSVMLIQLDRVVGENIVVRETKQTNDRGEFRFYRLQPGKYFIAGLAAGKLGEPRPLSVNDSENEFPVTTIYPNATDLEFASPIVLSPGQEVQAADITMRKQPHLSVSGRVVSQVPVPPPQGGTSTPPRPVPPPSGAMLMLVPRTKSYLPGLSKLNTITANPVTGEFRLDNVPPGAYELFARIPTTKGWAPKNPPDRATNPWAIGRTQIFIADRPLAGANVSITTGADLSGRIVLDNKPVQANIRLTIEADDIAARLSDGQLSGIYGQIKQFAAPIQADGTFRIPLVPEGNYRVQIEKIVSQRPGLVSMAQAYLVDIRQGNVSVLEDGVKAGSTLNEPLEILFKSGGGGVAGAVAGARDVMAGATVILVPQGDRKRINEFYRSSDTDAQGRFVFSEVAPGAYHAFALDKANLSGDTKLLYNPELTAPLEPMGIAVTVADGTTSRVDLSLIKTIAGR